MYCNPVFCKSLLCQIRFVRKRNCLDYIHRQFFVQINNLTFLYFKELIVGRWRLMAAHWVVVLLQLTTLHSRSIQNSSRDFSNKSKGPSIKKEIPKDFLLHFSWWDFLQTSINSETLSELLQRGKPDKKYIVICDSTIFRLPAVDYLRVISAALLVKRANKSQHASSNVFRKCEMSCVL